MDNEFNNLYIKKYVEALLPNANLFVIRNMLRLNGMYPVNTVSPIKLKIIHLIYSVTQVVAKNV